MAQRTLVSVICDNCDSQIADEHAVTTVTIKMTGERSHGMQVDLCETCGPRIKSLMDKGRPVRAGRPAKSATPTLTPSGRKRGRPSRADIAAREAAAREAEKNAAETEPAPAPESAETVPAPETAARAYVGGPDATLPEAPDDGHSIIRAAPDATFSAGPSA